MEKEINRSLYPFTSNYFNLQEGKMHFVDEGGGDPIVFVHGTPEWSFGYREQIKALSNDFRCIAVDHLGFGLSDKPAQANYSVQAHADRLEQFIESNNLGNIILVVNDFGGAIGINYAIKYPQKIKGIVLFNTWMWSLSNESRFSIPAKIMSTWFGRFLYMRLNFSVNFMMPQSYGDKSKLTEEIHRHYKLPFKRSRDRHATHALVKELINAGPFWDSLWSQTDRILDIPKLIFWGMKDSFIGSKELEKWIDRFPTATVDRYKAAGHFVQEEEPEWMTGSMRHWIYQLSGKKFSGKLKASELIF